jgi:hypothetical protein
LLVIFGLASPVDLFVSLYILDSMTDVRRLLSLAFLF